MLWWCTSQRCSNTAAAAAADTFQTSHWCNISLHCLQLLFTNFQIEEWGVKRPNGTAPNSRSQSTLLIVGWTEGSMTTFMTHYIQLWQAIGMSLSQMIKKRNFSIGKYSKYIIITNIISLLLWNNLISLYYVIISLNIWHNLLATSPQMYQVCEMLERRYKTIILRIFPAFCICTEESSKAADSAVNQRKTFPQITFLANQSPWPQTHPYINNILQTSTKCAFL